MLRFEDVKIRQGDFSLAADLSIAAGKHIAVIGPSGAGKSTLLAALGGFLPLECGQIFWNETDITHNRPGARPMAMLFQDNNLFPHLSVFQNVGLGLRPDLKLSQTDRQTVNAAIARVGLGGMEARKPAALSGGQQSRAALARVLVQQMPLLLLDEPFAALGPALRLEMLTLLRTLAQETHATLLMVTHAPEDVSGIADEVIFVENGRAHAPAVADTLMENPPPALRAYLGR